MTQAMRAVRSQGLYRTRNISPIARRQLAGCSCVTPRFGALGASAKATGAAAGASTGATVGSVVPVIGTAVGAVVGAVVGALFSKKKDPNAAEKLALKGQLDDYIKVQGQIPGRAFTLLMLKQLIDGAGLRGMWPNIKKWSGDAIGGAIDGCKGCTPPPIPAWVRQQVDAGNIDPTKLADLWTQHVNQTWGSKWLVATAGPTQRQLITDLMDYYVGLYKPDAPLFYAPTWTVAANQPAITTPYPVAPNVPGVPNVPPAQGQATPGSAPAQPAAVQVPPPLTGASDPNLKAYIDALMSQGVSQQNAFNAAMAALGNSGVAPTPQVQQAVAEQVQAGAGAGLPPWALYGLIGAGVIFALARPMGKRR